MTGHPFGVFVAFFGVFFLVRFEYILFFFALVLLGSSLDFKSSFLFFSGMTAQKKPKRVSSTNSYSFSFGNNTRNTYNIQYIRRNVRELEQIAVLKKYTGWAEIKVPKKRTEIKVPKVRFRWRLLVFSDLKLYRALIP